MKNIIYLSVSLVIYLAGIILLLVKLKHIIDNPERYDEPSLVAEADAARAVEIVPGAALPDDNDRHRP